MLFWRVVKVLESEASALYIGNKSQLLRGRAGITAEKRRRCNAVIQQSRPAPPRVCYRGRRTAPLAITSTEFHYPFANSQFWQRNHKNARRQPQAGESSGMSNLDAAIKNAENAAGDAQKDIEKALVRKNSFPRVSLSSVAEPTPSP
jgi:hypothetical protein